jgi:hypothetical protein
VALPNATSELRERQGSKGVALGARQFKPQPAPWLLDDGGREQEMFVGIQKPIAMLAFRFRRRRQKAPHAPRGTTQ